jgi:hypothetical protein
MIRNSAIILILCALACGGGTEEKASDSGQLLDPGPIPDTVTTIDPGPIVAPDLGPPPIWDNGSPIDTGSKSHDTPAPVDTAPAPIAEVRFVAMGDTGTGSTTQKEVADAIKAKCEADGCDFIILLGDNIYNNGVDSVTDPQWQSKFEEPYADLDIPFFPVIGNHDDGCLDIDIPFLDVCEQTEGSGTQFWKGEVQVAYTQHSEKWNLPARNHDFVHGPAHFFAMDSSTMMWRKATSTFPEAETRYAEQAIEVNQSLNASTSAWRIALGHHPYLSNGNHGNAGQYEGGLLDLAEGILSFIPGIGELTTAAQGTGVKESIEELVCDRVDLYLSGHDHSRQWFVSPDNCPDTEFVVSGAGAKTTEIDGSNPAYWEDASMEGFIWFKIIGNELLAEAIDKLGNVNFVRRLYKCNGVLSREPCSTSE